ncbi:cytochrome P450 [Syncephalastrum racemosum]|uniref:Cytochrome P450 n=1 Tax=Syncephalastrum racemosum TaxID=13706 RepID=A0A1X2HNI6_SYNRA|nr:cytochrome P450 [Syncephalastrum racemosum]
MDPVLQYYQEYLLPLLAKSQYLIKKHKATSIGAAVALTALFYIRRSFTKPPRHLQHLPHPRSFAYLKDVLTKESYNIIAERHTMPAAAKSVSGIISTREFLGWVVAITKPEAAKKMLMKTDLFPKLDTGDHLKDTILGRYLGPSNILTSNGHDWKKHRKIANPAFHRSMPVDLFGKQTHKLFRVMDGMDSQAVDVLDLTERFTLDIIGMAGFDFDFGAINGDSDWVRKYNSFSKDLFNPTFLAFPWIDRHFQWLFTHRKQVHKDLSDFLDMMDAMIDAKRLAIAQGKKNPALKDNEKDLLSLMIESEDESGGLTKEELKADLCIFFLAGHDTTSNALAFAIYHLAKYPHIQQKAREEALRILGDGPSEVLPTLEQTKELTYINQVIKETLRITPPVPMTMFRKTTDRVELGGTVLPKDTSVRLHMWEIQHDPETWSSPEIFDPERFAPGGEVERVASEGLAWLPFSSGSRVCIGQNFSMAEQRVFLSLILRKYEWFLPNDYELRTNNRGVLKPLNLNVSFKRRY